MPVIQDAHGGLYPGKTWPLPDDVQRLVDAHSKAGTVVGRDGGAQSDLAGLSPTLVPPEALLALSWVVGQGSKKYARGNWRAIPENEHLDHALTHIYLHMSGDRSERHLWNALTRVAFAVATSFGSHDYRAYEPLPEAVETAPAVATTSMTGKPFQPLPVAKKRR